MRPGVLPRAWRRLDALHGKVFPLEKIYLRVPRVEEGGLPEELWGSPEKIRRQKRREAETFLVLMVTMLLGIPVVKAHAGEHAGYAMGVFFTLLGPFLLWSIIRVAENAEWTLEKKALKRAKANPENLKMKWARNLDLEPLIREHLGNSLTADELEVARVLCGASPEFWSMYHSEFDGTVGELCELSRELCQERSPA